MNKETKRIASIASIGIFKILIKDRKEPGIVWEIRRCPISDRREENTQTERLKIFKQTERLKIERLKTFYLLSKKKKKRIFPGSNCGGD